MICYLSTKRIWWKWMCDFLITGYRKNAASSWCFPVLGLFVQRKSCHEIFEENSQEAYGEELKAWQAAPICTNPPPCPQEGSRCESRFSSPSQAFRLLLLWLTSGWNLTWDSKREPLFHIISLWEHRVTVVWSFQVLRGNLLCNNREVI